MERYFTQGDRAFKVMLYGGDEHDPSRAIEPGSEHWTEGEAADEARRMLRATVGHDGGLWWTASVERGEFAAYDDGDGHDWLEWERDERVPARWLVLVDGKVVDEE